MKKIDIQNMSADMKESAYLSYGVQEVQIGTFTAGNSNNGIPIIDMSMTNLAGTKSGTGRFYFPEGDAEDDVKNYKTNVRLIKHIATKIVTSEEFDQAYEMSANLQQFAINLNKLLTGKQVRLRLNGEEVLGKEGKSNWFKAVLPRNVYEDFAESMSVSPTKLVFDINNQYHMKRKTAPTAMPTTADTPF